MADRSDAQWEELRRELSARMAVFAPDWTGHADSDPGITVVELFGFLAESLLSRSDLSRNARIRLLEMLGQLERAGDPGCDDGTLTRTHYYSGKFLTAEDLERDQSYHRTRHRRHNRLLHGVGIVRGLEVSLEPGPGAGDPVVVVSPGVAIDPDGEEVVVCERVTHDVCQGVSACYVTLALVERPADATPDGEYAHTDETAEVAVSEDVPPRHLAIAHLRRERDVWRSDPSFTVPRIR